MRPFAIFLLSLIALISGLALTSQTHAVEPACASDTVTIRAATPEEAALACAGIADAIGFFRALGISTDVDIDVTVDGEVHAGDSADLAFPVLGQYRPKPNQVFLTSLDGQRAMADDNEVFRLPFDPVQFREVVAHEVGHVLIEHNVTADAPKRLLHEHIAYIVQFATMDPQRREAILAGYYTEPFEDELEINPMVYALSPDVFAVKSWLYFKAQEDGGAYLRRIMKANLASVSLLLYTMN